MQVCVLLCMKLPKLPPSIPRTILRFRIKLSPEGTSEPPD